MAVLIDSVDLSGNDVAPGESLEVSVALTAAAAGAMVSIDGIRGDRHVLQAPSRPGAWTIPVIAGLEALGTERRELEVTVRDEPRVIPLLSVRHDPFQAYSVVFTFPFDAFPDGTIFAWAVGPLAATTTLPVHAVDLAFLVDDTRLLTEVPVDVEIRFPDGTRQEARRTLTLWSVYQTIRSTGQVSPPVFGEGTATRQPFEGAGGLQMGKFRTNFRVRNVEPEELRFTSLQIQWMPPPSEPASPPEAPRAVDIRVPAGELLSHSVEFDIEAAPPGTTSCILHLSGAAGALPAHSEIALDLRTLAPGSIYELPPVQNAWPEEFRDWGIDIIRRTRPELEREGRLSEGGAWLVKEVAWALRRNAEALAAEPELQVLRVEGDGGPGVAGRFDPGLLVVEGGAARGGIGEPPAFDEGILLRRGAVLVSGDAAGGDRVAGAMLRQAPIPAQRLAGIPQENAIAVRPPAFDLGRYTRDIVDARFDIGPILRPPPEIAAGTPCDPDNLPADAPPGMACQFAGRYEDFIQPHRVMNAEKGDIFLSPGGSGVIGRLLRQVSPPQRYAHCGMFTRRQTEVAHATGCEDWLQEEHTGGVWEPPFGVAPAPSDGFKPESLKHLWPGGIVQSVQAAIETSSFKAPDGKSYKLEGFSPNAGFAQFSGNWESIPAVLVKPSPLEETMAVRGRLEAVADALRALCVTAEDTEAGRQSKLHYRFFCYTDAAIDTPAPPEAGWAAGTLPAVCSQVIWTAARAAGVAHFEGALEPEDRAAGAERVEGVPDGLYLYTAEERAAAAGWLHDYYLGVVEKSLEEKTNSGLVAAIWDLFSDIGDDVANQIVNTFAHDWSATEAKDSEKWRDEPRTGQAVSPDDLMRWDGPARGGLWGTVVPMDYRPPYPDRRPVYEWRQTSGPGTLRLVVRHRGAPVGGADVDVGGKRDVTDASGVVSLVLMEGPYVAWAGAHVDQLGFAENRAEVLVRFNETVEQVLDLQDPPDTKRLVSIEIRGTLSDAETFGADEVESVGARRDLRVHPWSTHAEWTWSDGVGGEVLAELAFKVDLNMDKSVRIRAKGSLWEGTDEAREDLEMERNWDWTVQPGETIVPSVDLWNEGEDEPGDALRAVLIIRNGVQS